MVPLCSSAPGLKKPPQSAAQRNTDVSVVAASLSSPSHTWLAVQMPEAAIMMAGPIEQAEPPPPRRRDPTPKEENKCKRKKKERMTKIKKKKDNKLQRNRSNPVNLPKKPCK